MAGVADPAPKLPHLPSLSAAAADASCCTASYCLVPGTAVLQGLVLSQRVPGGADPAPQKPYPVLLPLLLTCSAVCFVLLWCRGWYYHKEYKAWLTRAPNTEPVQKTDRCGAVGSRARCEGVLRGCGGRGGGG